MLSRLWRSLFAVGLVAGLSAVPITSVMACDCALTELPDAIRDADLAIVGTFVGQAEPAAGVARPQPIQSNYTWDVERSRDPLDSGQVSVTAWEDDGANCGVRFGSQERWLVLGYLEEGRMATNSCMQNQRLDGSDPQGEAIIESLLPVAAASSSTPSGDPSIPVPLIVAGAAVLLMGLIGLMAFRRGSAAP